MDAPTTPTLNLGTTTHCEVWRENIDGTNPRLVHVWMEPDKVDETVKRYNDEEADTAKTDGTPVQRRYFAVTVSTTRARKGS